MEVDVALHLYKNTFESSNKILHLKAIGASLKHKRNNPKYRLSEEMIEPEKLADLLSHTKVVAKPIYQLAIISNKLSF